MAQALGADPTKDDAQSEYLEMPTVPQTQDQQDIYFTPSEVNRQSSAVYDLANNTSDTYRVQPRPVERPTIKGKTQKTKGRTNTQIACISIILVFVAGILGFLLFQFLHGKVSLKAHWQQNITKCINNKYFLVYLLMC